MNLGVLFFFSNVMLGVGLAMDSFSVSVVNGLNEPDMQRLRRAAIAGVYAFFQWFMPMVGWLCVHLALERFKTFEPFIPWIAFVLLLYIGGEMIYEGLHCDCECSSCTVRLTPWTLFVQGVATAIDALSVGFTIASYDWKGAMTASVIIAAVTWIISMLGLEMGRVLGTKIRERASLLGGGILIAIGAEILLKSFF